MDNPLIRSTTAVIRWFSFASNISKARIVWRYVSLFALLWFILAMIIHAFSLDASALFSVGFLAAAFLAHIAFKKELMNTLNSLKTVDEINLLFARNTLISSVGSAAISLISFLVALQLNEPAFADGLMALAIGNIVLNILISRFSIPEHLRSNICSHSSSYYDTWDTSSYYSRAISDPTNPISPLYSHRHDR